MILGTSGMDGRATGFLQQDRQGDLALLTLSLAPRNALTPALRAALDAALAEALADPTIAAVVLCSALPDFSSGLDLAEADPPAHPTPADLCARIEGAAKPVIVALRGQVDGAALELALAAHGRVADADTQLCLPDVAWGLCPGAGASQRLPRLIGAEQALDMLLTGARRTAVQALAMGLLDQVVEGDPLAAAGDLAQRLAQAGPPRASLDRTDGLRDAVTFQRAIAAARQGLPPRGQADAAHAIVDTVEAALLLPAPQGMVFEAALHADLATRPEVAGLRHAAFAERRATRLRAAALPSVSDVVVRGAGGVAADLALAALQAGMAVHLTDPSREVLVAALERIASAQEAALKAGRLTQAALDAEWARLTPRLDPATLPDAAVSLLLSPDGPPAVDGSAVLSLGRAQAPGVMGLALAPAPGRLAEIALNDTVVPARATVAMGFFRRIGWAAVFTRPPVRDPATPAAVHLGRAIAETVSHLEARGVDRAQIARALAAAGIAGAAPGLRLDPDGAAIANRCLAALANAGAGLIAQGMLARPCEVDVVAIGAGLMARHTGGPMFHADRRGMLVLMRDLRAWAPENPALWQPAPLIERLWSEGRSFAVMDAGREGRAGAV